MPSLNHVYNHYRRYGLKHKQLYAASVMLLFFTIFDGIFSFVTPLVITQRGISEGVMGLIIGSSSLSGMLFDLMLCRILQDTRYRRVYLVMFIAGSVYPIVLWSSSVVWIYFLAMALWGLYYDLFNLGNFDFIARTTKSEEHSSSFGVMKVFIGLGYLIAPIVAGVAIGESVGFRPFALGWIFLALSFLVYLFLVFMKRKKSHPRSISAACPIARSTFAEIRLWKVIGKFILPVLLITFILNVIDSFFWTIGPLLSDSLGQWGSLFMTAYLVPPLFVGWFVGSISMKYGKKKTSIYSLFLGSAILSSFFFLETPALLVAGSLLSAFFMSFAWPSVSGAYADYISETPRVGKEIETLEDSFANFGFVIGPVLAGFSGEYMGNAATFTYLGILGILLSIFLLVITPRSINIILPRQRRK